MTVQVAILGAGVMGETLLSGLILGNVPLAGASAEEVSRRRLAASGVLSK